jgi:hypothetical protein
MTPMPAKYGDDRDRDDRDDDRRSRRRRDEDDDRPRRSRRDHGESGDQPKSVSILGLGALLGGICSLLLSFVPCIGAIAVIGGR